MPKIYAAHVKDDPTPPYHTHYRVFTGKDTAFEGRRGLTFWDDFQDVTDKTFMVVEATEAVLWTKPDELIYDPNEPLPRLGFRHPKYFLALTVDGYAVRIGHDKAEEDIRAWIVRHGKKKPIPER